MNDVNGFNDFLRVREISFLMFLRTEKHKSEIIQRKGRKFPYKSIFFPKKK